jgi:NADPH:quinone reductase-like Zn-dependent oxidoreductase
MKAIVQTRYGSPDVLSLQNIDTPKPAKGDVLVKVNTVSVTPADSAFRQGKPFVIKMLYGLRKPRFVVGGVEFSGEIAAVGAGVERFKVGDQVFGISADRFGGYAEYLTMSVGKAITHRPDWLSDEDATGIADGAATAQTFLREVANVQPGQRVLINGASGAVGAYAVQIAKYMGAEVTGVSSGKNLEWVKDLGADHVIDYQQQDFSQGDTHYDVIFDAVGKSSFNTAKQVLTATGIYMSTVISAQILWQTLITSKSQGKRAGFTTAGLKQSRDTLEYLASLAKKGAIRATVEREFSLEQLPDAHRYVDTGHKRGNAIVRVA